MSAQMLNKWPRNLMDPFKEAGSGQEQARARLAPRGNDQTLLRIGMQSFVEEIYHATVVSLALLAR